ncbi:MAG: PQQ-binding-like beta-propeller repeat protein [Planctomycetota bacterium]|nr:PQQ-binding-like beta-propeller repeat protein [Planctomycetota bacterium]
MCPVYRLFSVILITCVPLAASAENWPGWRGPRGDGSSTSQSLPMQWDAATGKNILWKTALPGTGHASPIIWDDHVFIATCNVELQSRQLIALDRKTGKILWNREVLKSRLEKKHSLNSFASSTPATDGKQVYVTFFEAEDREIPAPNVGSTRQIYPGKMVAAAYDFKGNLQWLVKPGEFISAHGFSTCPVLYKDLVILNGDHDGKSYILALNNQTGETVWKTERKHGIRSYATPILRTIDGQQHLVVSGSKRVVSLNPDTGQVRWIVEGPTEQFVASMVFDGSLFFVCAGFPTYHVMGIDPRGSGDVSESHVKWHVTNVRCYVPSPVVIDNFLLVADDRGTANCFHTKDGTRLWQDRLGNHFSASLLKANGLAYFLADDGTMKIVKPGTTLQVLAENRLGEYCYASPSIAHDQLFIRGENHLFCIGHSK